MLVGATVGGAAGAAGLRRPAHTGGAGHRREIRDRAKFGASMILTGARPRPRSAWPACRSTADAAADAGPARGPAPGQGQGRIGPAASWTPTLIAMRAASPQARPGEGPGGRAEVHHRLRPVPRPAAERRRPSRGTSTHLIDDPGLAPLKQAYARGHGTRTLLLRRFAQRVLRRPGHAGGGADGVLRPAPSSSPARGDDPVPLLADGGPAGPHPAVRQGQAAGGRGVEVAEGPRVGSKEATAWPGWPNRPRAAVQARDLAIQSGGLEFFELGPFALYMPGSAQAGMARNYETITTLQVPTSSPKVYPHPGRPRRLPGPGDGGEAVGPAGAAEGGDRRRRRPAEEELLRRGRRWTGPSRRRTTSAGRTSGRWPGRRSTTRCWAG